MDNPYLISLDDFPQDKKNCGNCSKKSGICFRNKSDKTIHNGVVFGLTGQPAGVIYCCPFYTLDKQLKNILSDKYQLNLF